MTKAVVTGGAGFLGSHLCERLVAEGFDVLCLDSLLTGAEENLAGLKGEPRFSYERFDVTNRIEVTSEVGWVLHLASPASPRDYLEHPIHTPKVGALGTLNALGLAKAKGASFSLRRRRKSTETRRCILSPSRTGERQSYRPAWVYDEAKRYAEAMGMAYHRAHGVPVRLVRIFNTYGKRQRRADGRGVPAFIDQALHHEPITVHGAGSQTRSLCYVGDLIEGFFRMITSNLTGPVNLGNPEEVTILELAETIRSLTGSSSEVIFVARPVDDPEKRKPCP